MDTSLPYQLLADLVLALHSGVVIFIVLGTVFIIVGNLRRWRWVNHFWLRFVHLAGMLSVAIGTWLDITCPLTDLERWLRIRADAETYSGSFIEYWLQQLLFYDFAPWMFVLTYTLFGLLILALWWIFPPNKKR
ncbi:MAG: DUF2784 domain-containing protein [Betaproteobacteria bacterium HGW-Betaproteobacteria-1]|jgi:hypothetical protein|nr:MAG: DUF2784 domain-containing protein [Betaproteobacteria bacterium HGW-Betaproteobacteria-1]